MTRNIQMVLCVAMTALGCTEKPTNEVETAPTRRVTYRSISGVSMGGASAASIALSTPTLWDSIGILGSPASDIRGFGRMIRRNWLSGFCSLEELEAMHAAGTDLNSQDAYCGLGSNAPLAAIQPELEVVPRDWLAPGQSPLLEFVSDYNTLYRGPRGGRGGSFGRTSLLESLEDLCMGWGNPFYAPNDDVAWAAPGVTSEWLEKSAAEQCAEPLVFKNFFNAEYNPNGTYDVITYCDGQENDPDNSPEALLGRLLPETPRTLPMPVLLAVDINGNGLRDFAEPVIDNSTERFEDTGTDGVADANEPGYDATTNPDPAGDNWDAFKNPLGTEGNYWWDNGEPYSDNGIDGVAGTGDVGENNGAFDYSPNWKAMEANDPNTLLANMPLAELERLKIYVDAGIRDFLNSTTITNRLFGIIKGRMGEDQVSEIQDFQSLAPEGEDFDPYVINSPKLKPYTYVRYGDVDATAGEINSGNGNHVGTPNQVLDRVLTSMAVLQQHWPKPILRTRGNGIGDPAYYGIDSYESQTLGREQQFSYVLPPGYFDEEYADETYPVLYFLHGQGQKHQDLLGSAFFFQSAMLEAQGIGKSTWAKFILVFPNGRCDEGVCSRGHFWADFASGNPGDRYRTDFFELMDVIDSRFRTRPAEDIPIE